MKEKQPPQEPQFNDASKDDDTQQHTRMRNFLQILFPHRFRPPVTGEMLAEALRPYVNLEIALREAEENTPNAKIYKFPSRDERLHDPDDPA